MYCADLAGKSPTNAADRAAVARWLLWEASAWFPLCFTHMVENIVKPLRNQQPDKKVLADAAPRAHQLAKGLDEHLSKTKWLVGDDITMADFAVAAPMHIWAAAGIPLDGYANVRRWYAEVAKVPAWHNTQAAVEDVLLPKSTATTNSTTET